MNDEAYKVMLELRMVSDPWPLEAAKLKVLDAELNNQASVRGFKDWVDAYHRMLPGPKIV